MMRVMHATGYLATADLEDGVLVLEGTTKVSRFAIDGQLGARMEKILDNTRAQAKNGYPTPEAEKAAVKRLNKLEWAAMQRQIPCIPVELIDRLEFKDASMLVNGRLDIYVGESRFQFHFRRKTRDEVRSFYETLDTEVRQAHA